jgi:hypothetical protein
MLLTELKGKASIGLSMFYSVLKHLKHRYDKSVHVFLLEYDLSPEHTFPAALNQSLAAYRHFLEQYTTVIIGISLFPSFL